MIFKPNWKILFNDNPVLQVCGKIIAVIYSLLDCRLIKSIWKVMAVSIKLWKCMCVPSSPSSNIYVIEKFTQISLSAAACVIANDEDKYVTIQTTGPNIRQPLK